MNAAPNDYSDIVNLFIDLRGRGLSLSSLDFDILQSWKVNNLSTELIAKIMIEMQSECKIKNKNFPNTLQPISRQLNKVLVKMRES